MLPDIVDGAIELVMQSQGPDRRSSDNDDFLKVVVDVGIDENSWVNVLGSTITLFK